MPFHDVTSAVVAHAAGGGFSSRGNPKAQFQSSEGRGGRSEESQIGGRDEQTVSRRGNFVPWVRGTARVAPVVVYTSDPIRQAEAGAYNRGACVHALACAGSQGGTSLECGVQIHRIWVDGRLVLAEELNNGPVSNIALTGSFHRPDGSLVTTKAGSFYVHWGSPTQPTNPILTTSDFYDFGTRFPGIMYAFWLNHPLKGTTQTITWPNIEYEISVFNLYVQGGTSGPAGIRWWHHGTAYLSGWTKPESNALAAGTAPVPGYRFRLSWAAAVGDLLFGSYPTGLGFSSYNVFAGGTKPKWNTDSLNLVDAGLQDDANEIQYTTLVAKDGTPASDVIGGALADAGVAARWNNTLGQYEFKLVRKETGSLPLITADMLIGPRPSRSLDHTEEKNDSLLFTFNDETRGHKQSTIPIFDDSAAYSGARINGGKWVPGAVHIGSRRTKSIPITSTTHHLTAEKIALRRAREELGAKNTYTIEANRDALTIHPGDQFYAEGFPGPLLAYRCTIDPDKGTVKIVAMESFFADSIDVVPPSSSGQGHQEILIPSDQVDFKAVPLSGYKGGAAGPQFYPVNLRPDYSAYSVKVWVSQDNVTYTDTGLELSSYGYCGGTLNTALAATGPSFLATGPSFLTSSEDDLNAFGETLAPTSDPYKQGDQMAVINDELFYVGSLVSLGSSSFRMDNVTRAAFESQRGSHAINDKVILFRTDQVPLLSDSLIQPNTQLWIKLQGVRNGIARDLSACTAHNVGLVQAPGIRYMPVASLTAIGNPTNPGVDQYSAGDSIDASWDFRSYELPDPPLPISSDTDFYSTPGPPIQGIFEIEVRSTAGGSVLNTYTSATNSFSYSSAQRLADFGASDPSDVYLTIYNTNTLVTPNLRSTGLQLHVTKV